MKLKITKQLTRSLRATSLLALPMLALSAKAQSVPVTVENPSFELGGGTDGNGNNEGSLLGWSSTTASGYGSGAGVNDSGTGGYQDFSNPLPSPADGNDYVHLQGGNTAQTDIYQDVGPLLADTTYTLTVACGGGHFAYQPGNGMIALLSGTDDTGTVLSSTSYVGATAFGTYNGSFIGFTTSFTTGDTVAGDLTIELAATTGFNAANNGVNMDNVQLTALTVPEPATYAYLLGGLGLLLILRRPLRESRKA